MKFVLQHTAAVKALSYCPWTKSLLATGGGTKDRNINFWHTKTGTLLSSYFTKGQITSLIWSTVKKEIVTTFGYGDGEFPLLLANYSYPSMIPILIVPATPDLRVLSASQSPDHGSICVATNDSTIRMYKIWDSNSHSLTYSPDLQGAGNYGSALIELHEGVDSKTCTIR